MWSLGCLLVELCNGKMLPPEFKFLEDMQDDRIMDLIQQTRPARGHIEDAWIADILDHTLLP